MDFGRRREIVHTSNVNGSVYCYGHGNGNGIINDRNKITNGPILENACFKVFPVVCSSSSSNTNCKSNLISSSYSPSSSSPVCYIEHRVTKMDTLAGVAIRYGVEVADIKKLNNLTTDLQMFALKTLQITLPGKHPPSPCLSNGHSTIGPSSSEHTPRRVNNDILKSFQSLRITPVCNATPAMISLQGYYGLDEQRNCSERFEVALYSGGNTSYNEEEGFFSTPSSMIRPFSQHRKSRSMANGFKTKEDDVAKDMDDVAKWIESLNKRRQKLEVDFSQTPEKLLREENGSGSWFSAITEKGLALRSKASSRTNLASETEAGGLPFDSNGAESSSGVRKSSSTSNLQNQEDSNNKSSSLWSAARWSLKPDLQAAIFDGLPKPITGRKSKAALD